MRLMFIKLTNFDSGEPMWLPTDASAVYVYQEKDSRTVFGPGVATVKQGERYTVYLARGERFAVREEPEEILDRLHRMCEIYDDAPETGVNIFDLTNNRDRPES